jgi:hypothetical protein
MKEIKNFLPKEQFKTLQNLVFDNNFPWRIRSEMVPGDKNMFFGHTFLIIYNQDLNIITHL